MWWRPDLAGWWMGVLFAIGSACFALASIASQWASVTRPGIGVTFFVGSLFFTTAAAVQLRDALGRRAGRAAAAIQFAGTLFFNVSTFLALQRGLDTHETNLRVWTPDVFGSVCFLVSSGLAYADVAPRRLAVQRRSLPWCCGALNLVGSIAFGVSAVTAFIRPATDEPVSAAIANATTTTGALCFLVGGLLLLPLSARPASAPSPPGAAGIILKG